MIMPGVRQPELPVFPESMMRSSARHRQSPLAGTKLLSHDCLARWTDLLIGPGGANVPATPGAGTRQHSGAPTQQRRACLGKFFSDSSAGPMSR